jgi:hypothetical protein
MIRRTAILGCTQPPFPAAVTFNVDGTVYAVNGTAEDAGDKDIDPIWKQAPDDQRVDIGGMIDKDLSLCPGGQAATPASTTRSSTQAHTPPKRPRAAPYSGVAPNTNSGPATDQSICPGAQVVTVDAESHTSCRFARNVATIARAAHHTTGHYPANLTAFSPVTKKTYRLRCVIAGFGSELLCTTPPPARGIVVISFKTSSAPTPPATSTPQPTVEGAGSFSHATDAQFCATHGCIENFPNGNGYIVQCADGNWSHSGGISGACSDHGGES